MKKSYEDIMERVVVTDEMKMRILDRIQSESFETSSAPKVVPFRKYKRFASLAACFAILVVGVWSAAKLIPPMEETPPDSGVQVVPDVVEACSAEELSELVGFEVGDVQGLPFEPTEAVYTAYWSEMAEIQYRNGEVEAVYRKSTGTEDISGDFNSYDTVQELTVGDITATLKGNSGTYLLAVWSKDSFSYSLSISSGAAEETWGGIIAKAV